MKNRRKLWKKRIGSLLLALGLLLGSLAQPAMTLEAAVVQNAWDGTSRTIPATDETGTFLITTGAELAWFADYVNAGHGDINGRLVNNIYLNTSQTSYAWVIIGNSVDHPYRGTFDGNGKRILNLRVKLSSDQPSQRYGGLFGVIDGGLVQDLQVSGTILNNYADKDSTTDHELYSASGAIVGYLKSGSVVNCTNTAKTTVGSFAFYRNAGGIAGISQGLIIRCRNEGNLSISVKLGQYRMGGIVGSMYGSGARTLYCENYGTVNGFFQVGGIAGCMQYGAEILSCCNYGSLSGRETLGGIVGKIAKAGTNSDGSSKQSVVRDAYSLGQITECNRYAGGIVGECGYDDGEEMDNPSMPVIENVYSTTQLSSIEYGAAVISYFKSGSLGNAYGLDAGVLNYNPVGQTRTAATKTTDTVEMLSEEDLKAGTMVTRLGSGFVACSKFFEDQNSGYPMLAWQIQTNSLAGQVNDGVLELAGWLTEANREAYGENYTTIESLVNTYVAQLGQVTTVSSLNSLMEEARTQLNEVPRSKDQEQELTEAIDNAITKLEEYLETKLAAQDDLTQEQIQTLESLVTTYASQIDQATSLVEVDDFLAAGKKAVDEKLADYAALDQLEQVRQEAQQELTDYRTDREYEEPWRSDITTARNKGLRLIGQADSLSGVNTALSEAKASIDAIIDQIPEEGAWDGSSYQEPALSENGIYQISTGAELAWFAQAVNQGNTAISGELVKDISLGNQNWTPIGSGKAYTGNFNGNGYTVRGLRITEGTSTAGLFGRLGGTQEQTIQNLTVVGSISCDRSAGYAGGIAAYVEGNATVYLDNCHSQVDISISRILTRDGAVGGLVGYAKNALIQNSSNQGAVAITSAGTGGLSYHSGGLVGYMDENVTLTRSYNAGYVEAEYSAGGLVGTVGGKDDTIVISAAYNLGEVQGGSYGGGLIGLMNVSITMNCCYSTGGVNLSHNGKYLGTLFGGAKKGNISNLYVLKRSDQTDRLLVGYSAGYNANGSFVSQAELQSDDMLNRLNQAGTNFIKDYLSQQDGYPLLEWQMSLEDFRLGVTTELQNLVSSENYTEENWTLVEKQIQAGLAAVQSAADREGINAAYTAAKEAIYAIETRAEAQAEALEKAKEEAVEFLKNYVDPSLYREEEQLEISQAVTDGTKWILSAETEEQVAEYLDQARENIDALPTAAQYQYEIDSAAAAQVDAYIDGIGEVVFAPYVRLSISQARTAYDALTEDQQLLVQNYQTLLDAEEAYQRLVEEYDITEEDQELAALVEEKIAAIGEAGQVSLESQELISQARTAYDALSQKQQALVTNLATLVEAENTYNNLKAREVSAAIAAIGEVTMDKLPLIRAAQSLYDALTDAQKELVTGYSILVQAKSNYENMVAAAAVIELIDKIGTVTLDSGSAVRLAAQAYNHLTSDQQALVTNYATLEAASAQYEAMASVNQVEDLIDRIGTVNTASGNLINQARSAYDALSLDLQGSVSNRDLLFNAEAAYAALLTDSQASLPNSSYGYSTVGGSGGTAYSSNSQNGTSQAATGNSAAAQTQTGKAAEASQDAAATEEATEGESALDKLVYDDETRGDSQEAMAISLEANQAETEEHRRKTLILGILVSAAAAIDLALGLVLRKAARKRKEKLMRY